MERANLGELYAGAALRGVCDTDIFWFGFNVYTRLKTESSLFG